MKRNATQYDVNVDRIIQGLLQGITYDQIAKQEERHLKYLTVGRGLIAGIARRLKDGQLRPSVHPSADVVPTFIYGVEPDNGGIPLYTGVLTVESQRVMVVGDEHYPYNDARLTATIPDVINYYQIDTLIWAGDKLDMKKQSSFPAMFSDKLRLADEERQAREAMEKIILDCPSIDKMYYFRGNHEDRITRRTNGDLDFLRYVSGFINTDILREKLIVSPYRRMNFIQDNELWSVVHPETNSDVYKTRSAEELAYKYNAHIVMTHIHKNAMQRDRHGRYKLVVIGGTHNPEMQEYVGMATNKNPAHEQGYATFVDGQVRIWSHDELFTDWGVIYG